MSEEELTVLVRRQWNSQQDARYRLSDISGVHWSNVSGGVWTRANTYYLHGYVSCDAALSGEVAHSCRHGEGPHSIKVCIVKKGQNPAALRLLQDRAGPKPG